MVRWHCSDDGQEKFEAHLDGLPADRYASPADTVCLKAARFHKKCVCDELPVQELASYGNESDDYPISIRSMNKISQYFDACFWLPAYTFSLKF
jgi:hypothetical protein